VVSRVSIVSKWLEELVLLLYC